MLSVLTVVTFLPSTKIATSCPGTVFEPVSCASFFEIIPLVDKLKLYCLIEASPNVFVTVLLLPAGVKLADTVNVLVFVVVEPEFVPWTSNVTLPVLLVVFTANWP